MYRYYNNFRSQWNWEWFNFPIRKNVGIMNLLEKNHEVWHWSYNQQNNVCSTSESLIKKQSHPQKKHFSQFLVSGNSRLPLFPGSTSSSYKRWACTHLLWDFQNPTLLWQNESFKLFLLICLLGFFPPFYHFSVKLSSDAREMKFKPVLML